MSHEMKGPSMMKQMQEYFQQNPKQYQEFMKIQQKIQVSDEEKKKAQMSSKEKLEFAKEKLKGKRLTKVQKSIIEKKEEDSAAEKAEEQKKIDNDQKEKEYRICLKKQRKYAKKKLKKQNSQIEKEFEVIA